MDVHTSIRKKRESPLRAALRLARIAKNARKKASGRKTRHSPRCSSFCCRIHCDAKPTHACNKQRPSASRLGRGSPTRPCTRSLRFRKFSSRARSRSELRRICATQSGDWKPCADRRTSVMDRTSRLANVFFASKKSAFDDDDFAQRDPEKRRAHRSAPLHIERVAGIDRRRTRQ